MSTIFLSEIFGIPLIDIEGIQTLGFRFFIDLVAVTILVRFIYYPRRRNRDYFFTFVAFNILVFFICFMLSGVTLGMGFAFGLFALFSLLRYRTDTVPVKEMTYLFAVITLGVLNSLSTKEVSFVELIISNTVIVLGILLLERYINRFNYGEKMINYERIENVHPARRGELLADLKERTGLDIKKIEIGKINFLNDTVRIKVHFPPRDDEYFTNVSEMGGNAEF